MIRNFFALAVVLLSVAGCADGYAYQPEARSAQPTKVTVINETNYSSSLSITINDGQRAGEHRGQPVFACYNLSDLQDHIDGFTSMYSNCGNTFLTTAEDAGYYHGHHIIRFMSRGMFMYGENPRQGYW